MFKLAINNTEIPASDATLFGIGTFHCVAEAEELDQLLGLVAMFNPNTGKYDQDITECPLLAAAGRSTNFVAIFDDTAGHPHVRDATQTAYKVEALWALFEEAGEAAMLPLVPFCHPVTKQWLSHDIICNSTELVQKI